MVLQLLQPQTGQRLRPGPRAIGAPVTRRRGGAGQNDSTRPGKLTYRTEVERDGQKWTSEFVGEIKGDKLIGKSTSQFNGQERVRDVEATRLKG